MPSVYFDADVTDDARRAVLYNGDLFICSPLPSSLALDQLRGAERH